MGALLLLLTGMTGTSLWTLKTVPTVEGCRFKKVDKSTDYLQEIEHGCFNL